MHLRHKIETAFSPQTFNIKKSFLLLGILWIIVHLFLFWRFGIVTEFESKKYIEQADFFLINGHYTSQNFVFYSIQILLIAISKLTNTFPLLIVFIQLIINALSLGLFYKLGLFFTKNHFRSFLITALLICMIYYETYDLYLFTESLYFSFGIIYTYILFSIKKLSLKNICFLFFGMVILYFTRPTGIFFIPSTFLYILIRFYKIKPGFVLPLLFFVGFSLFYFLLNATLNSGGELDFLKPYLYEMVICGVPTIKNQNNILNHIDNNEIGNLWFIVTNQPTLFINLAFKRFIAFYGVVRDYYSLPHNLFIALIFYTTYLLGIFNIKKQIRNFLPQTIYFICLIFFITITVVLSCDEWHNRFILGLLPFFLLIASNSFKNIFEKNSVSILK
jgi:hypothetical protein